MSVLGDNPTRGEISASICVTLVAFHSYPWIKVALRSLREFFPGIPVVIINQNPTPDQVCPESPGGYTEKNRLEIEWIYNQPNISVIDNSEPKDGWWGLPSHGSGLDCGAKWCKEKEYFVMIHFEPDCLVQGRRWFDELLEGIEQGYWYVSHDKRHYGALGPCGAAWRLDKISNSFRHIEKGSDIDRIEFKQLIDPCFIDHLEKTKGDRVSDWFRTNWDTGQKIWFESAIVGKTKYIGQASDLKHFKSGSRRTMTEAEEKELKIYLS